MIESLVMSKETNFIDHISSTFRLRKYRYSSALSYAVFSPSMYEMRELSHLRPDMDLWAKHRASLLM